ncbi:MAG: glycosyltransferase family 9 protein [Acidobacteria bacterium]|nr:glycosyltransferase family 9 protein [Acidobacteriota bacterium]
MPPQRILVVRLSALGDILHTLPAVAALKRTWPGCRVAWAVKPRFAELLEGGGAADEIIPIDRATYAGVRDAIRSLRAEPFDLALDFQGLIQSALVAIAARASRVIGFHASLVRERPAALLYSDTVQTQAAHVVDMNLDLVRAAGAHVGAATEFPLPEGQAEGELPPGPFVLAAPLAGWTSKQWPLEFYGELARLLREELGVPLVLNGAPFQAGHLSRIPGAILHLSSIRGLIDATRRAQATVGVDSGPMHLAAALNRPGVAIFGPTDPARNGPYSERVRVLRAPGAQTTYRRGTEIDPSMRAMTPLRVFTELKALL